MAKLLGLGGIPDNKCVKVLGAADLELGHALGGGLLDPGSCQRVSKDAIRCFAA